MENAIQVLSRLNISKFSLNMSFENCRHKLRLGVQAVIGRIIGTQNTPTLIVKSEQA